MAVRYLERLQGHGGGPAVPRRSREGFLRGSHGEDASGRSRQVRHRQAVAQLAQSKSFQDQRGEEIRSKELVGNMLVEFLSV